MKFFSMKAVPVIPRCMLRPFHSPLPNPNPNPHFLSQCKTLPSLRQLHAHLLVLGSLPHLLPHLITLYSSLGHPSASLLLFTSTPTPTTHLYNTIIRSLSTTPLHRTAIHLYHSMLHRPIPPDNYTFTFVLKACADCAAASPGQSVHQHIITRGLERDMFIATGLVDMYCKLGFLESARLVFDRMPVRDSVSWNAIIAGFSQSGNTTQALGAFRRMLLEMVVPNSVTLLNLLPAICELSDIRLSHTVHAFSIRRCFLRSVFNGLIDMYCKCGSAGVARRTFDHLSKSRDEVSWGTMISGYVYNGCYEEALGVFDDFMREPLHPTAKTNVVVVMSALVATAETGDLERGMEIHDYASRMGVDSCVSVRTVLVTMYVKCGDIHKAELVFDGIKKKDTVAWSAMISALVQIGRDREALSLFRRMHSESGEPNGVTIASILPACADLSRSTVGESLHCFALKSNFDSHVPVGTALVAMYVQCGLFSSANALFDGLRDKDVVTWNALINGYAQAGDAFNTLQMFRRLRYLGQCPDHGTMVGVLLAYAFMSVSNKGACAHGFVLKNGFGVDLHVKNAMIDMYAKCGDLRSAESLFIESRSFKDLISWNTMIAAYTHNGLASEALSIYYMMRYQSLKPNLVTLVSIIPAAASIASLKEGSILHSYVIKTGFESHVSVGNSMIDMYSKCGQIGLAWNFFNQMGSRDTVSWNSMLVGYAVNGLSENAIEFFSQMKQYTIPADSVSFLGILSACRHGGLLKEGRKIFDTMRSEHDLEPNLEHYACMVDLLGRAGQFDEAWGLIQRMPMAPDASVWGALLGACRTHSNVKMAEIAVNNLARLEPHVPTHYVVLSTIYAQTENWDGSRNMKETSSLTELNKVPGCSWVEIKNTMHTLGTGDESHL